MSGRAGYECSRCGEWHNEMPFSYHAAAPVYWSPEVAEHGMSELTQDQCVIQGVHFFIRGLIRLPVADAPRNFEWGVWISLSEDNFLRMADVWEQEGREAEPPMFGWLSTELTVYEPSTLNLKTMVHTQPVGLRPHVELEPTAHPLAVEQQEGITVARVQEFAERLLHEDSR